MFGCEQFRQEDNRIDATKRKYTIEPAGSAVEAMVAAAEAMEAAVMEAETTAAAQVSR